MTDKPSRFVEGGFEHNGQIYKHPKNTMHGYVAIKAYSWWLYFKKDDKTNLYHKFNESSKYDNKIEE